ncbi:MAG: hypothetical protein JRJ09_12645 [Deltaproteobacteria bacterium]|nr:hypothetical protein [Deltaproteobacteria bacterium]
MRPRVENPEWKGHAIFSDVDENGHIVTVHGGRIAGDVDPSNISGDAIIRGNCLLEGARTRVGSQTVIEDSYCKDTVIREGSVVRDSILIMSGQPESHQCDAAGRYIVRGTDVEVQSGVRIEHCHITDARVSAGSILTNSTLGNCDIGPGNEIDTARMILVHTEKQVRIDGPTEVSEAWLGRKTHIDRQGYFEGVFSDEFPVLDYDERSGELSVREILHIPHVSRYGTNTINSTNSGRVLSQPDGIMRDFGPQIGLWCDPLLSHEPILLGPLCWVSNWTKVIGKSTEAYKDPLETVLDRVHTYLMPFSVAGFGGESTFGLVMPGEKSTGYGNKQRSGAWSFTHCPDGVMRMVCRLREALDEDEKHKADVVVKASLANALCLLKYQARQLHIDLDRPRDQQRGSQAKWFCDTNRLLEAHIDSGMWVFKDGSPVGWTQQGQKWHHAKLDEIRSSGFSSDGKLDVSEDDLLTESSEGVFREVYLENALRPDELAQTTVTAGSIHHSAEIHPSAVIDQSARIGPEVRVGPDAYIGPGTVLEGRTVIGAGSRLFRAILRNTETGRDVRLVRCLATGTVQEQCVIGSNAKLTGCKILSCEIGDHSTGVDAKVVNSTLATKTTMSAFAVADNVRSTRPTIIGGAMTDCRINTVLMSMHSAGRVSGMVAEPVTVEVDGGSVEIPAVPMLGGGCQIHGKGTGSEAVVIEGAFVGSNAIIEASSFVGLGSFVLGRLGPNEGLLPFTISSRHGPQTDEIGAVLTKLSNLVITHMIGWTYQALHGEEAANVVHLVRGGIKQGISAIDYELHRREKGLRPGENQDFAKYKSLPLYSEEQLRRGLRTYQRSLRQGCWELVFDGKNLAFASTKGFWAEKQGHVCWREGTTD